MPDVSYHRITDKDEFVVLATDGVSRVTQISWLLNTTR
jgi:serine/threonine protein phosphatase PrpC